MTKSEDSILAKMPFPELTRVTGEPDYHKLHRARMQLYQNLAVIYCFWGQSKGHLGAGMPNTLFFQLYGENYVTPICPGAFDTGITNIKTDITKERRKAVHKELKVNYALHETVTSIAKKQWAQAIPEYMLTEIFDDYSGLNDVDLVLCLQHCFDREGIITDTMITKNMDQLQGQEFFIDEGSGKFIKTMEERQRFASTAGEPIMEQTMIRCANRAVNKHAAFLDDYKKWKTLPIADHSTWVQWKTFWSKAIHDHKEFLRLTAGDTGFGANAAE